jgi:hypothetical protein
MSLFHDKADDGDVDEIRKVQVICSSSIRRGYEKTSAFFIHPLFNGDMKWPMKTDIKCYHDHHTFDTIPVPLPVKYIDKTNTYTTFGIFCSASCVKGYMMSHPVHNNSLSLMYLKKMMVEVYGNNEEIVEAPSYCLLEDYGGYLDIETFRNVSTTGKRIITHMPPFMACSLAFELVKEHGGEKSTTTFAEDEKKARQKQKRLSRKKGGRKKPTASPRKPDKGIDLEAFSLGSLTSLTTLISPPPVKMVEERVDETPDTQMEDMTISGVYPTDHLDILPPSVTVVNANVANRWEIRNLQRPDEPIDARRPQKYRQGKSLYEDFLDEKKAQKIEPESLPKPARKRGRPKGKRSTAPSTSTRSSSKSNPDITSLDTRGSLISFLRST